MTVEANDDPFVCITHVGGPLPGDNRFRFSLVEAIAGIRGGAWTFHLVDKGGTELAVELVEHKGHAYLKTADDFVYPDRLVELAECH